MRRLAAALRTKAQTKNAPPSHDASGEASLAWCVLLPVSTLGESGGKQPHSKKIRYYLVNCRLVIAREITFS
jgi:hypothetical protein